MDKPDNAATQKSFDFDIALSFAGEDRPVAERLALLLTGRNVKVFYDFHLRAELWGKDHQHLQSVYRDKARYCIILISKAYEEKRWTRFELRQAQVRQIREGREYILALRLDDTDLPELNPTDFYMDLRTTDLNQICNVIMEKLGSNYVESTGATRQWTVEPPAVEKTIVKKSFPSHLGSIAQKRIPRLILIWIQLIIFGFLFGGIGSQTIGGLFIVSTVLIFVLSIPISRLVNRDILLSILVGGLVNGMLMSAIAFSLTTAAVKIGILFGVFFGASFTVYFSRPDKNTTLFTGLINTFFLIGATWVLMCSSYYRICFEILVDDTELSVRLATIAVVYGLMMAIMVKPLTYVFEFLVDKIFEIFSDSTDQSD